MCGYGFGGGASLAVVLGAASGATESSSNSSSGLAGFESAMFRCEAGVRACKRPWYSRSSRGEVRNEALLVSGVGESRRGRGVLEISKQHTRQLLAPEARCGLRRFESPAQRPNERRRANDGGDSVPVLICHGLPQSSQLLPAPRKNLRISQSLKSALSLVTGERMGGRRSGWNAPPPAVACR